VVRRALLVFRDDTYTNEYKGQTTGLTNSVWSIGIPLGDIEDY